MLWVSQSIEQIFPPKGSNSRHFVPESCAVTVNHPLILSEDDHFYSQGGWMISAPKQFKSCAPPFALCLVKIIGVQLWLMEQMSWNAMFFFYLTSFSLSVTSPQRFIAFYVSMGRFMIGSGWHTTQGQLVLRHTQFPSPVGCVTCKK